MLWLLILIGNNDDTASFKVKVKMADQIRTNGKYDVELMVPLKYLIFGEVLRCV